MTRLTTAALDEARRAVRWSETSSPRWTPTMEKPDRVLIVDDDEEFARMLGEFLRRLGFVPFHASGGLAALEWLERDEADLVVLDITMPDLDGLDALRTIRKTRDLPIIMVTARGQAQDRILGLELGADDYLAKPFDPNELAARIRAVLRRLRLAFSPRQPVCVGPLRLDPGAMTASIGSLDVRLTGAEFLLLEALAGQPGVARKREFLTERALGRQLTAYDRSIDTHVSNIRRKLRLSAKVGIEIRSVRGEGYCLTLTGPPL